MKKLFVYLVSLLVLGVKPVMAAFSQSGFSAGGIIEMLGGVLGNISNLFLMDWIGDNADGFLKFLLWVLVFAILYTVGLIVFAKYSDGGSGPKRIALVVSLVLATGTTLATPASLIAAVFASYATIIIFFLLGGSVALVVYVLYGSFLKETFPGTALHVIRIIGLILCWTILSIVTSSFASFTGTDAFGIEASLMSDITITLAQIAQVIFIVMIVFEVFRVFGSGSRSKEGQAAKDGFVNVAKKINQKLVDRRKKKEEDAKRKTKELEDLEKSKEELGRFIGNLSIDQRKRLETIKQGIDNLKIFLENEHRGKLFEVDVLKRVKSGILVPLNTELQKVRDDLAKLLYAARRSKIDMSSKKIIDDIEKDYEEVRKPVDDLLVAMLKKWKEYQDPKSGATDTDKSYLKDNINFTKGYLDSSSVNFKKIKYLCEKFKKDEVEQGHLKKTKELLDMMRRGRLKTSLDTMKKSLNKLYVAVNEIENGLKDPKKRGEALKKFEKSIRALESDYNVFVNGHSDFINKVGTLNSAVKLEEGMINELKATMSKIHNDFEEFKKSEKVKLWFDGTS